MTIGLTHLEYLPDDWEQACLIGRVWEPDLDGPTVCLIRDGELVDISDIAPTVSQLLALPDPVSILFQRLEARSIGPVSAILENSLYQNRDENSPWLLAPCDLQPVKASGVTFVASMLERVIEEKAGGDAARAADIRRDITAVIGDDLSKITPGSEEALQIKEILIRQNVWSQYLEVGIGPDAEIFSKAQPLSSVGFGAQAGLHPISHWNNPEPEIVLAVNGRAEIVGATLGNDVNLRDVEGRSALLLGKAKDNNGSCAIGPFIRLFDRHFSLDDVSLAEIALEVAGPDGFTLEGQSSMSKISRSPESLVGQACGAHHQYPDGFMLFLGTMFAPTKDRGAPGAGFTHEMGDRVSISTKSLGKLVNWMARSDEIPPWNFGIGQLIENLARRNLI